MISDVTERDGFEFADVISDMIYRRDTSMNSHRVQLWCVGCFGKEHPHWEEIELV